MNEQQMFDTVEAAARELARIVVEYDLLSVIDDAEPLTPEDRPRIIADKFIGYDAIQSLKALLKASEE